MIDVLRCAPCRRNSPRQNGTTLRSRILRRLRRRVLWGDTSPLQGSCRAPDGRCMVTAEKKAHFTIQVAVERLPVTAGELVEKKQRREISHFSAGECAERGRPVKALRCAPPADAARTERAALTNLPLRSCVASS